MSAPFRIPCVLVCGGRDYTDRDFLFATLDQLHAARSFCLVISGGARGADSLAEEWAKICGLPLQVFKADWQTHGRAAGPIRNQKMLDEGKPTLVVAFPGGRGTLDMTTRARSHGIEVIDVSAL